MYKVFSCYEHWGKTGIEVTKWFPVGHEHETKEKAELYLNEYKKLSEYTDKKTKLKHYFKINYFTVS